MNPLVSLQIVISVETLRALIAFEGPIIGKWQLLMLMLLVAVHILRVCSVSAVELWHHSMLHVADHGQLTPRTVHVRHDGTLHGRQ